MVEKYDNGDGRQKALDEPCFHDNGRFVDAFFFKKMMKRCDQKEFLFEIFFPKNLKETRCQIYDEEQEKYNERQDDPRPHVEKVEQRSNKSSQSERSAITHEDLGGVDIIKHESHQYGDHDSDYGRGDIRLIEE